MILVTLLMGCAGLMLSGHALTRYKDTGDARWATTGIFEILTGVFFIVASIGITSP
jgi:uncharacterized membrane protein